MLEAIENVYEFTQGISYAGLAQNKMLSHAVIHNIQVIGEAAYKLTKEFCESHPEVDWRDIIGLRHILVHDYYRIDLKELWHIVKEEIPPLKRQLEVFLNNMDA